MKRNRRTTLEINDALAEAMQSGIPYSQASKR